MKENTFNLKTEIEAKDLQMMTPKLFIVFGHFLTFATNNNLPVKVTNIKTKFPVSKSNTHPEGRAVDVSVADWSILHVQECLKYMKQNANKYGATSKSTGEQRVIYFHNAGLGDHFHIQVSR